MELIEIPRIKINDQYISASSVRRIMEENDKNKLYKLLPETTIKIIFND